MNTKISSPFKSPRARFFTRTQESAAKRTNKQYILTNTLNHRHYTYATTESKDSEGKTRSKSKLRSISTRNLFEKAKTNATSFGRTRSKQLISPFHTIQVSKESEKRHQNISKALQQVLSDKLNKKKELIIKRDPPDYEGIRKIVEETDKMITLKSKQIITSMVEQKKVYLQKSCGNQNINKLISEYVQTQQELSVKKKARRMLKTQVYNIQISSLMQNEKKKQKIIDNQPITKEKPVSVQQINLANKKIEESKIQAKITNSKHKFEKEVYIEPTLLKKQQKELQTAVSQNKNQKNNLQIKKQTKSKYQAQEIIDIDEIQQIQTINTKDIKIKENHQQVKNENKQSKQIKVEKQMRQAKQTKQAKQTRQAKLERQGKLAKQDENRKQKQRKQRLEKIEEQLNEANRTIDLMTPVGEVAGYCAQLLKKNKTNWHTPAILLYKYCYEKFKQHEPIFIKSAQVDIIQENEKDKYIEDNATILKNLQKVVTMAHKKNKLSQEHQKLINQPISSAFARIVQKEVLTFASSIFHSDEKSNPDILMCLLRMTNAIKIIGHLKGCKVKPQANIQQVEADDVMEFLQRDLQQISLKKLIL